MKILCRTLFDCSRTGVTGHFKATAMPFQDHAGQWVRNQHDWNKSRNQQRNWETLLQIIGLRTQPFELSNPVCDAGTWEFTFITESEGVYGLSDSADPLAGLKHDCDRVPMIINLDEEYGIDPCLVTQGQTQNIWFELVNTAMENSHV